MYQIHNGDCAEVMASMGDDSVDAVVTDPPYGLAFMGVAWDTFNDGRKGGSRTNATFDQVGGNHHPTCAADQARTRKSENEKFQERMTPIFAEALRVAKPGAHLLCFGGTRTFHRMACAIEDAGWEIRDCIMWVYGSGFPKSMDVAKAIDKSTGYVGEVIGERTVDVGMQGGHMHAGRKQQQVRALSDQAREWEGWGTCLKPAWEPIIVARKPLDGTVAANVLKWGVGAMNIDACRVAIEQGDDVFAKNPHTHSKGKDSGIYGTYKEQQGNWSGEKGRFPANVLHDGSQMVLELFPDTGKSSGGGMHTRGTAGAESTNVYGAYAGGTATKNVGMGDSGSAGRYFNTLRDGEESADRTYTDRGSTNFAAKPGMRREPTSADRFFYCAKASKKDRGEGNNHPTVKPVALMEWLVTLVTPQGGVVLDPFAGSGTTLVACERLGFDSIGIEREAEYVEIIKRRLGEE